MQNMEKYFGFRVHINSDLDPEDEELLKTKARQLVDVENINLAEYHVYLHQLIIRASDEHFNVEGGLAKRIKQLNIEFHINAKQRKNKDIRFMNHIIETGVPEEVRPYFNPDWIGYDIPVAYFQKRSWFQNAIIAFVKKDMRRDHKKIKVVVTTSPTSDFLKVLHSRALADAATELDLRFEGSVQLKLPLMERRAMHDDKSQFIFNNYGNAGAFGPDAVAHNFTQNSLFVADLATLAEHARRDGQTDESKKIDAAIDAIKQEKHIKALEYIKSFGSWTLSTAEKLGMAAATEAIKAAIGG